MVTLANTAGLIEPEIVIEFPIVMLEEDASQETLLKIIVLFPE